MSSVPLKRREDPAPVTRSNGDVLVHTLTQQLRAGTEIWKTPQGGFYYVPPEK